MLEGAVLMIALIIVAVSCCVWRCLVVADVPPALSRRDEDKVQYEDSKERSGNDKVRE